MPEFQPGREGLAGVSAPPLASQPDPRLEPSSAAPQSSRPPGAGSPPKPLWAALLEPGGAIEAEPPEAAQLAAPAPALGKTQAGNILASLASHSAVLATGPSMPPSVEPGAVPLVARSGPVDKATPPATSSLPASVAASRAATGAMSRSASAVASLKTTPSPLPGSPLPGSPLPGSPLPGSPLPGSPVPGSPAPRASGLGGPMPGGPLPGGPGLRGPIPGLPMPGLPMPGGPMPGGPMPGGPMPGGPASGRRATTASAPATAPITNANASRSPSETDEGAAAHRHDDDILPSKPRASFRMRLASRPLLAPKGTTYPQSAAPSPIVARPSLRERANGVSQLLSGRLRAYSRGRGSS